MMMMIHDDDDDDGLSRRMAPGVVAPTIFDSQHLLFSDRLFNSCHFPSYLGKPLFPCTHSKSDKDDANPVYSQ